MTEIQKAATKYIKSNYSPWLYKSLQECFIAGAEWQKKHYIDKACLERCEKLRNIHIAMIEELWHMWSLGDSTEAKYKEEAYQELLDILEEE